MKGEFHVLLPSDSCMKYYPDNTVARFTTQLPEEIKLQGKWVIGLTEFSFPSSFLNVKAGTLIDAFLFYPEDDTSYKKTSDCVIPKGYYNNPTLVTEELNAYIEGEDLEFTLNKNVYVSGVFNPGTHRVIVIHQSTHLINIIGFDENNLTVQIEEPTINAVRSMNLNGSMPRELFLYSDICEPYINGDVHAPFLTKLNVDFSKFDYWGMQSKAISTPRYLPILLTGFRTILIDIRDHFGNPAPFEHGRPSVTLHFKRLA